MNVRQVEENFGGAVVEYPTRVGKITSVPYSIIASLLIYESALYSMRLSSLVLSVQWRLRFQSLVCHARKPSCRPVVAAQS
jgi:hypothetical protein